jgi:ABC-type glycerol-3-phosphate transport system permease component
MNQTIAKKEILPPQSKVALFYLALVLAALIWFTPVITLVLTALKDAGDFARNGAFSLPKSIRWANFGEAWETGVKKLFLEQRYSYRLQSSHRNRHRVSGGVCFDPHAF